MPRTGRLLLTDADEIFVNSTADLLCREGYECDSAASGETAEQMLREGQYDLLIADLDTPGNRRLELVREVAATYEGMPVIVTTASPSLESAIESVQLPVIAYLVKPTDPQELIAWVHTGVERYRIFRSVSSTRRRLEDWSRNLDEIEEWVKTRPVNGSPVGVEAFLAVTFQNIVGGLMDLEHLAEALAARSPVQTACHLLNCPRLSTLADAVEETIGVLEKTKRAFKSKELGMLRQKLENIISQVQA